MKVLNWSSRPQKELVREYAVEGLTPKRNTLWLPGGECKCVSLALERGVLHPNGQAIFVERERVYLPPIEAWISQQKWVNRPILHAGELHNLLLSWKLDYAFLDFLGTFEQKVALWMANTLAPNLSPGADLGVTHAFGWRNNSLMYAVQQAFENGPYKSLYMQLRSDLKVPSPNFLVPLGMMACLFRNWDYEIRWPAYYKDSVRSMTFYRLENFQPRKEAVWPSVEELLKLPIPEKYQKKPKAKTVAQKRSDAARKAWETRRRNKQ